MDVGPSNRNMGKGHFPWSHFMVHGVNPTLNNAMCIESNPHQLCSHYVDLAGPTILIEKVHLASQPTVTTNHRSFQQV
jgi:hypothetical protein